MQVGPKVTLNTDWDTYKKHIKEKLGINLVNLNHTHKPPHSGFVKLKREGK